ncbi:MAG: carboxylesterase family protein [Gammaproteobacteria bacterium]|nr:carboxylesterase family protein [Gammaproteobacteria bacterium]
MPGRNRTLACISTTAVVCALIAIAPLQAQTVEHPIAPIRTSGGLLAGKVLPSGVKVWLGVPFAKPPVQELRWRPPQSVAWQGVWNADRKMPECIQVLRPHNINHYFGEEATGEDCLYLNIWAPGDSHEGSNLPVVVFIYGGGNTIGSSGLALYSGEPMARTGRAVFVNLNYRLGLLGFLAHPELTKEQHGHSGNYAYLDQNAAIRWVHDNIGKFGGDPTKVLIMGQSAGALSVTQQMFSPLSRGLFRAAMMSSGCSWTSGGLLGSRIPTLEEAEKTGLEVQQRLNATNLSDMRQVPADKLLALQAEFQLGNSTAGIRVGPIIDGYFMPKSRLSALQTHEFNDVPIMVGFNREDLDAFNPLVTAKTVADYQAVAARLYGTDAAEFLRLFPVTKDSEIHSVGLLAAREADLEAGARNCASLQAQYGRSSAYIYMFALNPSFAPGANMADLNPTTAGAYHTADVPFWLGTQDVFNMFHPNRAWNDWDRELSADMMTALVAFASTGNPNTPAVTWPAWSPTRERKLVFDDTTHAEDLDTRRMDWLAAHPAKTLAAPAPVRPRD